jgi:hypothetical protein
MKQVCWELTTWLMKRLSSVVRCWRLIQEVTWRRGVVMSYSNVDRVMSNSTRDGLSRF